MMKILPEKQRLKRRSLYSVASIHTPGMKKGMIKGKERENTVSQKTIRSFHRPSHLKKLSNNTSFVRDKQNTHFVVTPFL